MTDPLVDARHRLQHHPNVPTGDGKGILLLVLFAFAVRVLAMIILAPYRAGTEAGAWSNETGLISTALATGRGFSDPFGVPTGPTAWLMPVYPGVVALVFKIFGVCTAASSAALVSLDCIASALTCIPVFLISRRVFGRATAYLSAGMFALYPPGISQAVTRLWSTTVFVLLAMMLLYWLIILPRRQSLLESSLFAAYSGVVALVTAVSLSLYPFALAWVWFRYRVSYARKALLLSIMVAVMAGTLAPWLVRNARAIGRPMLKSNLGLELRVGNCPKAWGYLTCARHDRIQYADHPLNTDEELGVFAAMGEIRYVDTCMREALEYIFEDPGRFLLYSLRRIYKFWLRDPSELFAGASLRSALSAESMRVLLYIVPLPFTLMGIAMSASRRYVDAIPLYAYLFFMPVIYYATHVRHRYRYPIEPVLLIFTAYALVRIWQWTISRRSAKGRKHLLV